MAQSQTTEKLHAACDECRTRKLKCSGEKATCGRCQRESIACIYSPQKTVGRPRKRRRGSEAEATVEHPVATQSGYDNSLSELTTQPSFSSFGLVSPPEFVDVPSNNEVYAAAQIDPSLVGIYGPSPPMHEIDLNFTSIIDPSLWDTQLPSQDVHTNHQPPAQQATPPSQPSMGPCTCLSLAYLTLTDLQAVPTFSFPQVVIPLRKAMSTVSSLLCCPICPRDPFSAIQNVSSLVSLFKAIVERFSKVLAEIDRETAQLSAKGIKKPFRMGDNNPALSHLHTGTLDCPMGFNVELEPDVWKTLVKTALKTELDGGGSNPLPLRRLLGEVEERQQRWHTDRDFLGEERRRVWGEERCDEERGTCEGLGAEHIRRAMDMLNWN